MCVHVCVYTVCEPQVNACECVCVRKHLHECAPRVHECLCVHTLHVGAWYLMPVSVCVHVHICVHLCVSMHMEVHVCTYAHM